MLVAATAGKNVDLQKSHGALLRHFTGHLNEKEIAFFKQWDRLIDLEAKASNQNVTKAWLMNSVDREKLTAKCISSLVVCDMESFGQHVIEQNQENKDSFIVKLRRSEDSLVTTALNTLQFDFGSRVILSSDVTVLHESNNNKHFGIVRGTIALIESNAVHVRVGEADLKRIGQMKDRSLQTFRLRLDKDEFSAGTGTLRQNIMNLLTADITPYAGKVGLTQELLNSIHDRTRTRLPWLRRSIIHLVEPKFDASLALNIFDEPNGANQIGGCNFDDLRRQYEDLNIDQKRAIEKVRRYANPFLLHCLYNDVTLSVSTLFMLRLSVQKTTPLYKGSQEQGRLQQLHF